MQELEGGVREIKMYVREEMVSSGGREMWAARRSELKETQVRRACENLPLMLPKCEPHQCYLALVRLPQRSHGQRKN